MKKKTYAVRYSATQKGERIFSHEENQHYHELTQNNNLQILVWNIFKQQRAQCLSMLRQYGYDSQLVLLQESHLTPELLDFAKYHHWIADHVPAFSINHHTAGVMSLARTAPIRSHAFKQREPLLMLPKSALITVYPLKDHQPLMVANVHSVNFTLGTRSYAQQLNVLIESMSVHQGPLILAGDFNTWSRRRRYVLFRKIAELKLKEVKFADDLRKRVFGCPLDFIFYRELDVVDAKVIKTEASDHNPLLVNFRY